MGCSYAWNDHSVIKTFDGFVSGIDFIRSAEAVSADPRFDELRIIFNDFLAIEGHSVDSAAYRRVETCRRGAMKTNPNFRVIFIAAEPTYSQLASAIEWADSSPPFHTRMCETFAAGRFWLARQPLLGQLRSEG